MARDGKKRTARSNFPSPGGQPQIKIPDRPFMRHKIACAISNDKSMSKRTDAAERVEYHIKRIPTMRAKYLVFMLKLRDDLKRELDKVFYKGVFHVKNINKYLHVVEHPNLKQLGESTMYGRVKLQDGDRLIIEVMIQDFLLLIEEHLIDILAAIQLSNCPDYKEISDDTSS